MGATGTWAQAEGVKGGQPDRGSQTQAHVRKSFGPAGNGVNQRRAVLAGRQGRRPSGRSLCDRVRWGGKKRVQRER